MNRKITWLAAGAGALALLAGLAPWTFSGSAMRRELALQVRETTGLIAEARGRTTLAILPRPRIKIEDVTIRDREGKLLIKADTLRGNLRILPAFAGRMEVSSVSLASPDIQIDIDGKPLTSEGAIARASEARPSTKEAVSADAARLASLSVRNGTARLIRDGAEISVLRDVDMTLDWRSLSVPAGLQANFSWAGEQVDVTAWLGQPAQVLRGESSPVSMRLDSPSLKMSANGILSGGGTLAYSGKFQASAPALRDVIARNGIYLPLPGPLAGLALTADARATLRSIQLSELDFKLDGNSYEGAVILSGNQGRPSLMGTLAARQLDLDPVLQDVPRLSESDNRWSRTPLPTPDFSRADVDLRISANSAQIGRLQVRDAGLSILVASGKAELAIAEAKAFGGTIKARLSAEPSPAGYDVRATAAFAKVESSGLMSEAFRNARVSGEATGELALAGQGSNVDQLVNSLRGTMTFDLTNGDFAGLDLEQALRRLEKRPLSIASEIRSGRTTFDTAHVNIELSNGDATLRSVEAKGAGVEFSVTGSASVARRLLDLTIKARQAKREAGDASPQLELELKGPWNNPALLFDAQSLIRRSQAAAPLLRSIAPPARIDPDDAEAVQ